MKNWIELNGKSSNSINGLLIQELPPITKPKLRTKTETVDGRDGDIVNILGYSAYDKKFAIGLYGNFDIDQVIKFFDSSGKVVFSNEPDKYYSYQLIDEINFERLVRFRTATVKFHVQPFKFSTEELPKTFNVEGISDPEIAIRNNGNIYARPTLTLKGGGTINLSLNGEELFVVYFPTENSTITIDTNTMEAFQGENLMNRYVDGNYNNFKLEQGRNIISWTGSLTEITISNYSRWR